MHDDKRPGDGVEQYLKTTFLARVAHDIRGPAGVTLTAIDELENALGPAAAREHAALLGILKRSSRRILRVAEKLSRGAEAAAGSPFQVSSTRIRPIIERAVRDAESVEGRRNIAIEVEVSPALGKAGSDVGLVDASWFETLAIEIVSNAIKHARSRVRVQLEERGDKIAFAVTDDGRTGAPKIRALFEPSNERNGLGLSLSLADLSMRAQQGALEVSEVAGGGSTVTMLVSRAATTSAAVAPGGNGKGTPAAVPAARPRVLVVDDDEDTVDLVSYALERAGFAPTTARSLSEATALLDEVHPDAMITDLSLPDGSGTDLATLPAAKLLKTKILVSGHSGAVVSRHTGAEGFDHQLVKPVDLDELIQLLTRSLGR